MIDKAPIEKDAEKIADIIVSTDTDLRGNLFLLISENISKNTQFFTASLLKEIAIKYGLQ